MIDNDDTIIVHDNLHEVAMALGITEESLREATDRLSERGVSGAEGGIALRKILKELQNEQS